MNTNKGNDPMLCSFLSDDWTKLVMTCAASPNLPQTSSNPFTLPVEGLLSPEPNSALSDLASMWRSDRKRVTSIKIEEEDTFPNSPYSGNVQVDNEDMDDMENSTGITQVKNEIEDPDYHDNSLVSSINGHEDDDYEMKTFHMAESEARQLVEERFQKIATVPSAGLSQREKIAFILSKSDSSEYSVDTILNFDKKSGDSARACAKIVQNIAQRYRWECVKPEDIPCCYTIVADCKKVSSRDKPPRPMNAFMIWAQGARRLINELCPKMQNALISEALGYYWRLKSDAFKKRFEQEKIKLRRFHNVEFPEYKYKPKTKVQKAKEKQELSLSKAKMRACLKREKMQQAEETSLCRRRSSGKCGRPRKAKPEPDENVLTHVSRCHSPGSDKPVKMSPTKPAIKDMLTLKILNDRRSKGVVSTMPRPQEALHCAFGQLSPLEVDSPCGVADIFEEFGHLETEQGHQDKDMNGKSVSSSVYDTPANTPPVDMEEEPHLSPLQSTIMPSSTTSVSTHQQPSSSSVTPKQMMPSLSAMLASPSRTGSCGKRRPNVAVGDFQQHSEYSDILLTFVTDVMTPAAFKSNVFRTKTIGSSSSSSSSIDANNNSSEVKSTVQRDDNNNTVNLTPGHVTSVLSSKRNPSFGELSDLEAVALDLNVPFLSDEELRSYLNSL